MGANWNGKYGYTDGAQQICTVPERDLGFPYEYAAFGKDVSSMMMGIFSWQAYSVIDGSPKYGEWVARGKHRPTHQRFAAYLNRAIDQSEAKVITGHVGALSARNAGWTVTVDSGPSSGDYSPFDGVVVTGPGPQNSRISRPVDERIFTGEDFWLSLPKVKRLALSSEEPIVLVGAGGTSAAIAGWLVRNGLSDRPIRIMADQPTLYTRVDSYFENSLFYDETAWEALSLQHKTEFFNRLNRSVVWKSVSDELAQARNISFLYGRADKFVIKPRPDGTTELVAKYLPSGHTTALSEPASIIVDATGFDPWWFVEITSGLPPVDVVKWKEAMRPNLSLGLRGFPPLHAPNLSEARGPGYGSLMVLGDMADRVLRTYTP